MSDYNLGSARGRIVIESDTRGLDETRDKVKKTGGDTEAALGKVGRTAGIAGLAVAGGLAVAVKTAADFEKGLSGIKAVSGGTAGEMELVRAKALQIGKDTAFSAGEASSAMEELVKAGISIPDTLNGAADAVVALAAAGAVDLPTAATIASNSMNQFNLTAQDMTGVVDKIAGAANASAIDVGDFGMSLSQVGAVANLAGLSFDDTAVAIAEMGNAGIKGSDAGTSLKTMLMNLQPQTKKQIDLMKKLGLVTKDGNNEFFDQNGKLKSLKDIQGLLNKTLGFGTDSQARINQAIKDGVQPTKAMQEEAKKMGKAQQFASLETIFGSDAIRAAAVLAGEGAAGYDKMNAAIDKTSAADVAKTRLDNFSGSLEQLKGSAETLGIQIGSVLLPAVRSIVDAVTAAVNWFLNLDEGTKKVLTIIAAATAGFLLFGAATIKAVGFAKDMHGAFKTIGEAMGGLSKQRIKDMALSVKQGAIWVLQTAKLVAQTVIMGVIRGATLAWTAAQWLLNAALNANPIGLIIIAVIALVAAILWLWNNNEGFRNFVIAAWEAIKTAVMAVAKWFTDTLLPWLSAVWDGIKAGLQAIGDFFVSVWNGIVSFLTTVFNVIRAIITTYINIWRTIIETVFNAIKTVVTTVWNAIMTVIRTVINVITGIITTYVNIWKTIFTTVFNVIKSVVSTAVDFVKRVIFGWSVIIAKVTEIFNSIKNGISTKLTEAINFVKGIPGKIMSALGNLGSLLLDAGKAIIGGLLRGITDKFNEVKDYVSGIATWISEHKGPLSEDKVLLVKHGEAIMDGFHNGIKKSNHLVQETVKGIGKQTAKNMNSKNAANGAKKAGAAVSKAYQDGLKTKAAARSALEDNLKAATDKLKEAAATYKDYRDNIAKTVTDTGNIVGIFNQQVQDGMTPTLDTINADLRDKINQAKTFANDLAALAKKGVDKGLIDSLVQAGVGDASAVASMLATSSPEQLAQFKSLQAQLAAQGVSIGTTAANAMYGAGVKAAEGLVLGLRSQKLGIAKAITDMVNQVVAQIRKELKIKSPSQVTMALGSLTGEGFADGLRASLGSMGNVGQAFRSGAVGALPATSGRPALPAGGGTTTVHLVVNNPVPERASDSLFRQMQRVEAEGLGG